MRIECIHNLVEIPEDGVSMISLWRVEPKIDPLFSVSFSSCEHIRLQYRWLSRSVSEKLEVYLIMLIVRRR